ncbi:hypothetical protein SAMN04487906_3368 [Zhouia amylolytica]|uniref:Uncharacterized protein n=1 Tax=Zhouia amylolytica TaxID=376730 RepID=A0A1I6VTW8_9FLAO|nr:DUF6095 family protein [Zhouia amylolytica]MCQ0112934.1 hypothetical protein [Zhouia amylolytica]SFT17148.1 hypothetical protein SAMN04487906_3368 [Zhouia amylolytica]
MEQHRTDKKLFAKSFKYFAYTLALMFIAPILIYQAFKNEGHPFYWPVLITGVLSAFAAIAMGFYSIKIMLQAFFGKK